MGDFDYGAAFPQYQDGVPETITVAAEWAHDELGDDQLDWLRRLPAERRVRAGDDQLVLVVHASPGSQTRGFDQALDANVIFERAAATDARIICVGHTHMPEVRDLGWKVIVNDGSRGLRLRRRPDGLVGDGDRGRDGRLRGDPPDRVRRPGGRQRDQRARPPGRRLPRRHGAHGEARPMTWSWPERPRRVVVTGMGAVTALGQDVASTWDGLVAGRSGVAPITLFDASRVSVKIAAEVKDFDPSGVLDRKEMRRTDRYIQFALVTRAPGAGPRRPARPPRRRPWPPGPA